MPKAGDVLDKKFRLIRLLGEGGMGTVWEAEHFILDHRVALKVLHPALAHEHESVQRLFGEARAATAIEHDGVVDVLDVGWADDVPYLVMELLHGESLSRMVGRRCGRLEPGEAASIVCGILDVLRAVHAAKIVHRDLKPENIFLCACEEGEQRLKILDFGISKITNDQAAGRLTKTGVVVGTPYYMSPEQARGERRVDGRVDIWAVGAILYELLVGRVPYEGESYNEVLAKILTGTPLPPREIEPEIPAELERVVLKALSRSTDERYRRTEDFLRDLAPLASDDVKIDDESTFEPVEDVVAADGADAPVFSSAAPRDMSPTTERSLIAEAGLDPSRVRRRRVAVVVSIVAVVVLSGAVAGVVGIGPRWPDPLADAPDAPRSAADHQLDPVPAPSLDASKREDGGLRRARSHRSHRRRGDAHARSASADRGEPDSVGGDEWGLLSRREVATELTRHRAMFRLCLDRATPPLSSVQVRILVSGDGRAVYRGATPAPSGTVGWCLQHALSQVRFRATGESQSIRWPIRASASADE